MGVRGSVAGHELALGNTALMDDLGANPGAHVDVAERMRREGSSAMFLAVDGRLAGLVRSEEHTSELQSLMRISSAVFCLKKKTQKQQLDLYTEDTQH